MLMKDNFDYVASMSELGVFVLPSEVSNES